MIFRMRDYHSLIRSKIPDLPIRQHVVYLGKGKSKMRTSLNKEEIFTGYNLINITEFSPDTLAIDDIPESIVLSVLAYNGSEPPEEVVGSIISKLQKAVQDPTKLRRYLRQLLSFSSLRNLEDEVQKQIDAMAIDLNVREISYVKEAVEEAVEEARIEAIREGIEQGIEQGSKLNTDNLITANLKKGKQIEIIADMLDVSAEYVLQIKQQKGL